MSGPQTGKIHNTNSLQKISPARKLWKTLAALPTHLNPASLLLLSLLTGGILSLYCGIDANYDLKKYHLHNAWAFLNGRLDIDLFPAGLQTYYHPLLDVPYYLFAVEWFPNSPKIVALLMGIPAGFVIFLTLICIYQILQTLPNLREENRRIFTALLAFFGLSGTSFVIQIGSTTNEVQTACLVLGALAAFLTLRKRPIAAATIAGALLGASVGFKLTAVPYTVAFAIGMLFLNPIRTPNFRRLFAFGAAWLTLFLAIYGWWGWTLYKLTGNPVFPMYNNLFKSDWLPATALPGSWFVPQSLKEILLFPFSWVNSRAISAAEGTDLRFAFAYTAAAILLLFWISLRRKKEFNGNKNRNGNENRNFSGNNLANKTPLFPKTIKFIFVFLLLSFVIWEFLFSVLRYAIPLEVLLGIVPFIATWYILESLGIKSSNPNKTPCLAAIFVATTFLASATTRYPFWGRLPQQSFSQNSKLFDISVPAIPENSLVILYTPETQFLAPFLAQKNPSVTFLGVGDDPLFLLQAMKESGLHKRILQRIRQHQGPILLLAHYGYPRSANPLRDFGLSISENIYLRIRANYDQANVGDFYLFHAENLNSAKAANAKNKAAFINDVLLPNLKPLQSENSDAKNPANLELSNRLQYIYGWQAIGDGKQWKSTSKTARIDFFLSEEEVKKFTSAQLELTGEWIYPEGFSLALNGEILSPQNDSTKDSVRLFSIPRNLLRDVAQGANVLTFSWRGARAADDLPWPLVRRPRSGKLPLDAFRFQQLRLLPQISPSEVSPPPTLPSKKEV